MEKEERWSTRGKINGQTPRDLCNKLFLALADSCEEGFLSLVESNFLPDKKAERAKNFIFNEVDTGVVDFKIVQGVMERKMSSGAFSFRVFNTLMKKHNVFESNDMVRVNDRSYFIETTKIGKPVLAGRGKLNGYSLRRLLADGIKFYREVDNPDQDFLGFLNSLKDTPSELYVN
jgi:uncharacterized protein YchJ